MRNILVVLLCLGLIGCVHYTPREKAAINAYYRGDPNAFASLTSEELDVLEAKIMEEQMWLNSFSAGARGAGEGAVSTLYETANRTPTTFTPQQYILTNPSSPSFGDGYQGGYKDGYQYSEGGGVKPIAPIAPISPIPDIGENTYDDGYTRGIIEGQKQRKGGGF
mgnify:CR=1 FL=1